MMNLGPVCHKRRPNVVALDDRALVLAFVVQVGLLQIMISPRNERGTVRAPEAFRRIQGRQV
jgi:CMP-2-keto-3-deoxyoctulosonic acid synthetase